MLVADKDIVMNAGTATHEERFDVSEVMKTVKDINLVIQRNSISYADGGGVLDVKADPTGSVPLECLRNVNNQIKHTYKVRRKRHAWEYCNYAYHQPPM